MVLGNRVPTPMDAETNSKQSLDLRLICSWLTSARIVTHSFTLTFELVDLCVLLKIVAIRILLSLLFRWTVVEGGEIKVFGSSREFLLSLH